MNDDDIQVEAPSPEQLRDQAIRSLRKKEHFRTSLIAYVLVNLFLVGIWAISGADYFWPIWVIGGWGLGLAFQALDAYGRRRTISEDRISREMDRLKS